MYFCRQLFHHRCNFLTEPRSTHVHVSVGPCVAAATILDLYSGQRAGHATKGSPPLAVKTKVKLRSATADDLLFINGIIEAAVMSWALPERVKRLSMPNYRYDAKAFAGVHMQVASDVDGDIVGLIAWRAPADNDVLEDRKALLLHGVFVDTPNHRHGVGRTLVKCCIKAAKEQSLDGVLVKAQPDAFEFFQALKFEQLPVVDEELDYKHRYWLSTQE